MKVYSFEEFAALGAGKPAPPTPPAAEDYCTIMYTSGTTGDPKASVWAQARIRVRVRSRTLAPELHELPRHAQLASERLDPAKLGTAPRWRGTDVWLMPCSRIKKTALQPCN